MHAPTLKRTTLTQFIGLALVLGLVASLALNVAMLARSDDDAVPVAGPETSSAMLAKEQRYYDAKMARQEAMEAAAGAQVAQSGALTASKQHYSDLKADQLNGISARASSAAPYDGPIDVDQMLADQRAALAAKSRFFEAKLDRMLGGR